MTIKVDRQKAAQDLEVIANNSASMPLVSVIVPTRNRALFLQRALKSVLGQTYPNLEIVVVDDASTDETRDVVAGLNNQAIRYIRHDSSKGGSGARNTGIRAATGKYVAFLDDDDEWEPSKTEEQLRMLQKYDVVFCTSNEDIVDLRKYDRKTEVTLDDLRKGHFTAGGTAVLMASANVMKEEMFDEELPRGQDWDIFIRLAQKHTVGYLNRPLVRYNEGAHSRISNEIIDMPAEELVKRLRMLDKHKAFFGPRWFNRHMSRFLLYHVRHRRDKWQQLLFAVRICGIAAVAWALSRRILLRFTGIT